MDKSKMIVDNIKQILQEIDSVLTLTSDKEVDVFIEQILRADKIVTAGAGRVGMAIRGFSMRLAHLGMNSYHLGDATVPSLGNKDLFIVASGSGETQTIYDLVCIAKKNNTPIALITGNPESRMGEEASVVVQIQAPSKTKSVGVLHSIQPMTTLNEQCLGIFFDAVVLSLMEKMNETHDTMWARHSNLE